MERLIEIRTIGRGGDCDLVIDGEDVDENHARVGMSPDGGVVMIHDAATDTTSLNRGNGWVPVYRTRLCAGDRYRFGRVEVPVGALVELFEGEAEVVEPDCAGPRPLRLITGHTGHSKRDPGTGQIESLPDRINKGGEPTC